MPGNSRAGSFSKKMKTGYKVCDAMTKRPVFVSPNHTIEECAREMENKKVGSILIKNWDELAGIITDQDIVRKIIANGIDPKEAKIKDHMSTNLTTISPEKDIFEAIELMTQLNLKQLPVMDGKKMVGLLSQKDILKLEPELFDLLADKLEIKEEAEKPTGNEGICEECGNFSKKLVMRKDALICRECAK